MSAHTYKKLNKLTVMFDSVIQIVLPLGIDRYMYSIIIQAKYQNMKCLIGFKISWIYSHDNRAWSLVISAHDHFGP